MPGKSLDTDKVNMGIPTWHGHTPLACRERTSFSLWWRDANSIPADMQVEESRVYLLGPTQ